MDAILYARDLVKAQEDSPVMEDSVLVAAARSGDPVAFDQLANRHSRRVLSRIYRITGNWQDSEDVLQESLLKAFTHLDTFEGKSSFSTWLTRIAINTALMLLRKRRAHVETALTVRSDELGVSDRWEPADKSENPEQHYAREQTSQLLRAAVLRLRSGTRQILELKHKTDCSVKEIARYLGISEPAAKSRLIRARAELRASLKPAHGYCHTRQMTPQ